MPRFSTLPAARISLPCADQTLGRAVCAHADVNAVRTIAIAQFQQRQSIFDSPLGRGLEPQRGVVDHGQPVDVAHRQPVRDGSRRSCP